MSWLVSYGRLCAMLRGQANNPAYMGPLRVEKLGRALEILRGLVESESEPCSFDHHGHCQEHGWLGEPGECGVREARQLLGVGDEPPRTGRPSGY